MSMNYDILATARCGAQFRTERMAAFGLKGFHISYITHICAFPGISQDKLSQKIFLNKSNVARQAAFLEEEGFITRTPSATDKRVMELYPTEKALALLPEIHDILEQWEALITADLTPEELETAGPILDKMQRRAATWLNDRH